RKAQYRGENEEPVSVEELALEHYRREGWKGFHSENSIITTLWGMLFWDILFDDSVPGAFNSPYQAAPLDLFTEFFYDWKNFEKDDVLEIADCIGGPRLAKICGLFAKTYFAHSGGVPDL
ncbi:hypothetical protein BDK51DRAFT_11527, partial [Blyttiomyces helicus]